MVAVPDGHEWLHEVELEGERALVHRRGSTVRFLGREGPLGHALQEVAASVLALDCEDLVIDGEVIAVDASGRADAETLRSGGVCELVAFDVLYLDGWDLRSAPLGERKLLLRELIDGTDNVNFAEHVVGNGARFFQWACDLGAHGVVSKRSGSRYGDADAWRVTRCGGGT